MLKNFVIVVATLLLTPAVALAETEMGDRDTPGARMPVGEYRCGMGSYKARPCQMVKEGADYFLVVPDKIGHFLPMKLQVLGTDEAGELIVTGKATNPSRICGSEKKAADCRAQTLTAVLKQGKSGTWRGTMAYFIMRQSKFRHGVAERLFIRPAKRR